jgi:hypothetical protein
MNPRACEALSDAVADILLYLCLASIGGLIAMSACWYGGLAAMQAYHEWQSAGPPKRRRQRRDRLAREAERGIHEIEAYLDAFASQPPDPKN